MSSVFEQFQWRPQPAAQALINHLLPGFLAGSPGAQTLAPRSEPATQADDIEGEPLAPMRRARAFAGADAPATVPPTSALGSQCSSELWVIERHGYRGWTIPKPDPDRALLGFRHAEAFRRRTRDFD